MSFPDNHLTADPSEVALLGAVQLDGNVVSDIEELLGYAAGIVFLICVAKLVFVGARMAWDHKHGAGLESPKAAELIAANIGALLAGGVSITIATVLLASAYGPQTAAPNQQADIVQEIKNKPKPQVEQQQYEQESE